MLKIFKQFPKDNLIILFLIIISSLGTIMASFKTAAIINSIIQLNFSNFLANIIELLVAYAFFLLFSYFKILKIGATIQKMETRLREEALSKIFQSNYQEFHEKDTGMYVSWLTNDITQIEQSGFNPFYEMVSGLVVSVFSIISLLMIHWSLVLVTAIELLLIIQIPKIFDKKIKQVTNDLMSANESFVSHSTDVVSSFDTLFVYRKFDFGLNKLIKASKKLELKKNNATKVMGLVAIVGGVGNILGQVSILSLSGYLAFINIISIGLISASGQFSSEIFNTLGNLSQYIASIKSTKSIFDKLELIDSNSMIENKLNIKPLNSAFSVKNLTYSYNNQHTVLSDINMEFELNKKYAIVGDSGSGKSTLLNLLSKRIIDFKGTIMLNDTDINELSTDDVFSKVAYIDQNPYIFNGSIRENLCLNDNYPEEKLITTLKQVNLFDTINNLEMKLDTYLGENGRLLSGGQLQRLALARALLRNKRIILLDEGTSKLDRKNTQFIEEFLISQSHITLIMITHH
ncbi:ABC transporter ATP-binding protein, partial [Vagococcus fluvialis]|uniref:ATP-binding cassette domain-containing protein n=1 Tax=Vagococcus fluvialis TaxID=2738 RepID=UPI0037D538CB